MKLEEEKDEKKVDSSDPHRLKLIHADFIKLTGLILANIAHSN
jgi:hypothetical protein